MLSSSFSLLTPEAKAVYRARMPPNRRAVCPSCWRQGTFKPALGLVKYRTAKAIFPTAILMCSNIIFYDSYLIFMDFDVIFHNKDTIF